MARIFPLWVLNRPLSTVGDKHAVGLRLKHRHEQPFIPASRRDHDVSPFQQACHHPRLWLRQNDGAVGRDGDRMLKVGGKTTVFRHRSPSVAEDFHLVRAGIDHGFNG